MRILAEGHTTKETKTHVNGNNDDDGGVQGKVVLSRLLHGVVAGRSNHHKSQGITNNSKKLGQVERSFPEEVFVVDMETVLADTVAIDELNDTE